MQLAFAGDVSGDRMQQGATYSLSSPDLAARKSGHSRKPAKKRKATHLVRKEEKDALQEKLLALKAELAGLKAQTLTPEEAVRKDVSGAVVLMSNRAKVGNANQDPSDKNGASAEALVVTMHRAVFIKLHRPQFTVSEAALQDLHEGIALWGDVMLQTVRSIVYATP